MTLTWRQYLLAGAMIYGPSGLVQARLQAQRPVQGVAVDVERNDKAPEVFRRPVTIDLDGVSLRSAIDAIGRGTKIRMSYQGQDVDAVRTSVTLHVKNLPVGVALDRVLGGTGLEAVPITSEMIAIRVNDATPASVVQGIIVGKVIDAKSKQGLRGVTVTLVVDAANRTTTTRDDGSFRIPNVGPGKYVLNARVLGYVKAVKTVVVVDGETTTTDFALDPSVSALDQVIVTGTVIPTELKAVPNAMTVITAKDIEQRGITHIDQLFRGDVPGLFAQNHGTFAPLGAVTMFSRGATRLPYGAGYNLASTNPIKTYVDGVELADPEYLSQIDPRTIERIEILTGPQASTIYGSNAINGVMQVFTKRGTTAAPQLTLNLLGGWVQNSVSSALTPQHLYSAQLSGVERRISYNVNSTWNHLGAWSPNTKMTRLNDAGGARLELPTPLGARPMSPSSKIIRRIFGRLERMGLPQATRQTAGTSPRVKCTWASGILRRTH